MYQVQFLIGAKTKFMKRLKNEKLRMYKKVTNETTYEPKIVSPQDSTIPFHTCGILFPSITKNHGDELSLANQNLINTKMMIGCRGDL